MNKHNQYKVITLCSYTQGRYINRRETWLLTPGRDTPTLPAVLFLSFFLSLNLQRYVFFSSTPPRTGVTLLQTEGVLRAKVPLSVDASHPAFVWRSGRDRLRIVCSRWGSTHSAGKSNHTSPNSLTGSFRFTWSLSWASMINLKCLSFSSKQVTL